MASRQYPWPQKHKSKSRKKLKFFSNLYFSKENRRNEDENNPYYLTKDKQLPNKNVHKKRRLDSISTASTSSMASTENSEILAVYESKI